MDYVVRLTERALSPRLDAVRVLGCSHSLKGNVVRQMRWMHAQIEPRHTGSACIVLRKADGRSGGRAVPGRSGAALRAKRNKGDGESEPYRPRLEVLSERVAAHGLEVEARIGYSEPRRRRSGSLSELPGPSSASPDARGPNPEPHYGNLEV